LGKPASTTAFDGRGHDLKAGVLEVHAGVPYQNMLIGAPWAYSWQLDGKEVSGQQDLSWSFGQSVCSISI